MEIRSVTDYDKILTGGKSENTFVLSMQTKEATIQLQCKKSTHTKEHTQITAELLKDAKQQLPKLPEISSGFGRGSLTSNLPHWNKSLLLDAALIHCLYRYRLEGRPRR